MRKERGRGKKERKTENPQETRPVLKIHMQSQAWKYVRQRRGQRRSPLEFLHVQPRGPGVGKSSSMASRWTSIDPRPHTSTFSWTRRRDTIYSEELKVQQGFSGGLYHIIHDSFRIHENRLLITERSFFIFQLWGNVFLIIFLTSLLINWSPWIEYSPFLKNGNWTYTLGIIVEFVAVFIPFFNLCLAWIVIMYGISYWDTN